MTYDENTTLDSTINFRPLPLVKRSCESNIASGILFRTGSLTKLSDIDAQTLAKKLHIKVFVDLRTDREKAVDGLPDKIIDLGIDYIPSPIDTRDPVFFCIKHPSDLDYTNHYIYTLDYINDAVLNIVKLINQDRYPIAYGCSAGKDRTGVVSGLILKLLGFSNNEIASEYALTGNQLKTKIDYFKKNWEKLSITKEEYIYRLDPSEDIMLDFLTYFDKKYSSIEDYFISIGVTVKEINRLKYLLKNSNL